jgi:hypothetical protein
MFVKHLAIRKPLIFLASLYLKKICLCHCSELSFSKSCCHALTLNHFLTYVCVVISQCLSACSSSFLRFFLQLNAHEWLSKTRLGCWRAPNHGSGGLLSGSIWLAPRFLLFLPPHPLAIVLVQFLVLCLCLDIWPWSPSVTNKQSVCSVCINARSVSMFCLFPLLAVLLLSSSRLGLQLYAFLDAVNFN